MIPVIPVRKCVSAARVVALITLIAGALFILRAWYDREVSGHTSLNENFEAELERQVLWDEALQDAAAGTVDTATDAHAAAEARRRALNVFLSDRTPYNRTIPDHRAAACSRARYPGLLPSASVVVVFHDEPYSALVRTVWSVLNSAHRTQPWYRPPHNGPTLGYRGQDPNSTYVYLREVILVDDASTEKELGDKLAYYVRTRFPPLVTLLRLPHRSGLMAARMAGARAARGSALVFLDAHCEVGADWLRPLLARVHAARTAVVSPVIDVIDQTTFRLEAADDFQVGGFTFSGHFVWVGVSERERRRRGGDAEPTRSPAMAGGLFAMRRAYFWELGGYDELMTGWGGENLEMSFRVWQCGGTLEVVGCSRVGHVFRAHHPYALPAPDTHGANTARAAAVWMDHYAELLYLYRPDLRDSPAAGDVTHRRVLRDKLHCKSFRWYLENVYSEKFVPVRDCAAYGRVANAQSGLCLDGLGAEGAAPPLGLSPCRGAAGAPPPTQLFYLSFAGELRDEERCAEVQYSRSGRGGAARRVLMLPCHGRGRGQKWIWVRGGQLQHVESRLCLDARGADAAGRGDGAAEAGARPCHSTSDLHQLWIIDYSQENNYTLPGEDVHSERYVRLAVVRSHRAHARARAA